LTAHSRRAHSRTSATGGVRIPALDGVRAVGLLLIMGFHFGIGWMPAGFVGVDVFYVLSGYLITGLLLGEWARTARIRLGAFWARRARRLLPALVLLLLVVTLVVRFTYPAGLYPNMRMADLSALFYFSNWWQIAASGNYFVASGAVSPLTHTWTLAVEEQFYLVWPLVALAVLHFGRRITRRTDRGVELLLGVSVVGVAASAIGMAVLYDRGTDVTRLYFGTDTHAQSILLGSGLACILTLVQRHRGLAGMAPTAASRPARVGLTVLGLAGAVGTLVLAASLSGTSPFLYRGGFLVSALCAGALITGAVCVTGGPIARVLAVRPMAWVGTVSYGAYLWHFPVVIELDAARTGLHGSDLVALRVAATFVLAALSYYLVERPIMEGAFWRSVKSAGPALATLGATVVVIVAGTVVPATAASVQSLKATSNRFVTAHGSAPVMVYGDSTALTLGLALSAWAQTSRDGIEVTDQALVGCGIAESRYFVADGVVAPVTPACNTSSPADQQWPAVLAGKLKRYHPKVLVFLVGRTELYDRIDPHGRSTNINDPAYASYIRQQLQRVVNLSADAGTHVVLLTSPYFQSGEEPDGQFRPEDQPERTRAFNRLVAQVAAANPRWATLLDLNAMVSPGGKFAFSIHGMAIRTPDGIHFPFYDLNDPSAASPDTFTQVAAFAHWIGPQIDRVIIQIIRKG
jgi:peptidoglycan/LPS O-acetylase OafA/YrhL